ncbi:MAG: riboflavin synthase [Methylococcales bacterium]|nr:riboflavin synthase [Methylococcales bacterium]
MFTGIIKAVGQIAQLTPRGSDLRLRIATGKLDLSDAQPGDSIAVNGVCLTAVELGTAFFCADVSNESLSRTTLGNAQAGTAVNLELALTPTSRLGGHIVSGHVDGIGTLTAIEPDGHSYRVIVQAPSNLARYIAEKGSITLDGISLTVNQVQGASFSVNIVPHTWQETNLATLQPGCEINLEVDLIARYLERLLLGERAADVNATTLDLAFLQRTGFAEHE